MDPSARVVVPVVQVLEALPRGARDPELVCTRGLFCESLPSWVVGDASRVEIQGKYASFPREVFQTLTAGDKGVK